MPSSKVGIDYRSTIGSNGWSKDLEGFLGCKIVFRPFLQSMESTSYCPFVLSVLDNQQIRE